MRNDVFDSSSSIFECDKNKKLDPLVFMSQKGERNQMQSMVTIHWTCGGVAKMAIILIVRSQMDKTDHFP